MSKLMTIPKAEWRTFFDRVSRALLGKWAEIEVASLELGDESTAEWVPMLGITYDWKDSPLDVGLDRQSHLIRHPRQIIIPEAGSGIASIAVLDADGTRQIISLKNPLMLQAASTPQ